MGWIRTWKLLLRCAFICAVFIAGCWFEHFRHASVCTQSQQPVATAKAFQATDEPTAKPAGKRDPHDQLLPGEKCTLELAKQLNPKSNSFLQKKIIDTKKQGEKNQTDFNSTLTRIILAAEKLPTIGPIPDLDQGIFPTAKTNASWYRYKLDAKTVDVDGKKICRLKLANAGNLKAPETVLNGDLKKYALMAVEVLNNDDDPDVSDQGGFISSVDFINFSDRYKDVIEIGGKAAEEVLRPLMSEIAANSTAVKLLGPWIKSNMLPRLDDNGKTQAMLRIKQLWLRTEIDFKTLHKAIGAGDCTGESPYSCDKRFEADRYGIMYRRWLNAGGTRGGDKMIIIYRIWMAVYAHKLGDPIAQEWIKAAKKDVEDLDSDRLFYKNQLSKLR